ncbi:MAG: MFS transporter [Methanobrevibacter sp.]|nr:MFS transporter [Methanobrevibacter sp.]
MIVQGIGHGLFSPPNNRYVLTLVDDDLGDASSMLTSSKEIGKTVSLSNIM